VRLLIVDDEAGLADSLERGFRNRGFAVDVAYDGAAALEKALVNDYDVVLLDRDLPAVHGDEVCRQLIEAGRGARILMLTAASELDDLVHGFSLGADDYVAKPFRFAELLARVTALVRRSPSPSSVTLDHGDITMNAERQTAQRAGRELALTPREFAVLEVLLRAGPRVVSSEELLEKAWDEHADPFTASVRVIMSRLRSKLGEPSAIATVVGKGYRLCLDE
jgi:DNA-binding response OmpR family regulator